MRGAGKEIVVQPRSGIVAIEGYLRFERAISLQAIYFHFRLLQLYY
jgi:hypothetical protein